MSKTTAKILSILLTAALLFSCAPTAVFASLFQTTLPSDISVVSENTYEISPGVSETHIIMNNDAGTRQNLGYALTVEVGEENTILAGYKDYDGSKPGLQTLRYQIAHAEEKTGCDIVAGINAQPFSTDGTPTGFLVMNGVEYFSDPADGSKAAAPFFAILKDGRAVIRDKGSSTEDVKEAVALWAICVKNGENVSPHRYDMDLTDHPRTAIGIRADGSVVMYVNDGRQNPVSSGVTWSEIADILIGLGCVTAGHFDGGGSSTLLSKHEGEDTLTCRNMPSDTVERKVSTSLFVVRKTETTGTFDHASVTPAGGTYRAGTTVSFSATGVDAAGGPARLPAGGSFALSDPSFGTISQDGKFVSNGKTGQVSIEYRVNGASVGSTEIKIQTDDPAKIGKESGFVVDKASGKLMYSHRGKLLKNQWLAVGTDVYYLDANGYVVTGQQKITEKITPAKVYVTGFPLQNAISLTYTFDAQGRLTDGVLYKTNGSTYYIYGGRAHYGWQMVDGDWYFFNSSDSGSYYGKLRTGRFTSQSITSTTNDRTGRLTRGFLDVEEDGTRYIWARSYVQGWQAIDGKLYYFDPNNMDRMVTGQAVIDGKTYTFNADGTLKDGQNPGITIPNYCSYCGKDHGTSFLGRLTSFLHLILNILRSLFA